MAAQRVRFGKFSVPVPQSKVLRIGLGGGLCLGGFAGFLPVLGFWMLPLGVAVLAVDFPPARRVLRRSSVWVGRLQQGRRARMEARQANRADHTHPPTS